MEVPIVKAEDEKELATVQAALKSSKISRTNGKKTSYDPDFVVKIERSMQEVKDGKVTTVKKADLKNLLGL